MVNEPYDQDTEEIDEMLVLLSDVFDGLWSYKLTENEDYLTDAMWALASYRAEGGGLD
jgi:hypothetical protein